MATAKLASRSRVDQPLVETLEDELLEFARFPGPGTRIYPSPRPEVRDLVLKPMVWVQVDPVFKLSGEFVRDRKADVFESIKSPGAPENINLEIRADIAAILTPDQIELVRMIILNTEKPLRKEFVSALSIAEQIDQTTGFPAKDSLVTTSYLRERQRPFLTALDEVERRHQNRQPLLDLIKKQLSLIATLPGK